LGGIILFTADDDFDDTTPEPNVIEEPPEPVEDTAGTDPAAETSDNQCVEEEGVTIRIEGQTMELDGQTAYALREACGLFRHFYSMRMRDIAIDDFPGGMSVFRETFAIIINSEVDSHLRINDSNVLNLYEAAWLLECPQLLDKVTHSPYMQALSTDRRSALVCSVQRFMDAEEAKVKAAKKSS